jgi:sulfite exporter TauE/SafE
MCKALSLIPSTANTHKKKKKERQEIKWYPLSQIGHIYTIYTYMCVCIIFFGAGDGTQDLMRA